MKTLYTAEVTSEGGRNGSVESIEGNLDMDLRAPPEMGGDENGSLNPEQLFAAAYAACFHGALLNAAKRAHAEVKGSSLTAVVSLYEDEKGGYSLGVELRAMLPGIDPEQGQKLLEEAHRTCPYSKAVRNNIDVKLCVA